MAFVSVEVRLSERTACKLLGVERSSYRYEPRPDRNLALREELVKLARQKPRYGYRRLHALLERRGYEVNVKRVYRLYAEEGLAVRRRRHCATQQRSSNSCAAEQLGYVSRGRWRWRIRSLPPWRRVPSPV